MQHRTIFAPLAIAAALSFANVAFAGNDLVAQQALAQVDANASRLAKADGDQFFARDSIVDADGTTHVRLDRRHQGLRVIGGDVVTHSDRAGTLRTATLTLAQPLSVNSVAQVDSDLAIDVAELHFAMEGQRQAPSEAELVIYARDDEPRLAYEVGVTGRRYDGTPSESHYVVDADFARILDHWDTVETTAAAGTGKSLFLGTVALTTDKPSSGNYVLRDPGRGNQYTANLNHRSSSSGTLFTDADNAWGSGALADAATVAVDAQFGAATTWDYYKNVHGRSGIANDGRGAYSLVHYGNNYVNAFWSDSCFCMSYGDGDGTSYYPLVSLDVAGHEMSHGVTSRTAKLIYSGESGGLNEATSDIFGTMVEFYANNAADKPDYLIGERLLMSNPNGTKALRYMFKPSLDGKSPDCYTTSIGSLNVHYSSGVANHFYYLLAEGATVPTGFSSLTPSSLVCNGDTAAGKIGRDAAQKIWYRALSVYMTSSTKYAAARTATLNAAKDLYGATSTQYTAVNKAWAAVGVK